jgi:uncharacterized membrane protein (Fun14 family)
VRDRPGDGAVVGYATGYAAQPPPVAAMQAAIAAARTVVLASFAKYGELSDVYEAMASILAWNTMFTPVEGVVTPVSRGWDFGAGYVIFVRMAPARPPARPPSRPPAPCTPPAHGRAARADDAL